LRDLERRFIFRVSRFSKDKNVRGTACILMAIDKGSARPRGKFAGSAYDAEDKETPQEEKDKSEHTGQPPEE